MTAPAAPPPPETAPQAPDLLATLEELVAAATPDAVLAALAGAARAAGFETVLHAETSGTGTSAFVPALTRLRSSDPPPDPSRFVIGRFLALPAVLRAAKETGCQPLRAPACGIEAGRLLSLAPGSIEGRRALVAFLARRSSGQTGNDDGPEQAWARHGRALAALAGLADLRLAQLRPGPGPGLRPRQREVLAWVASGKTTAEIATILGLTRGAVEKHLRLARDALSAETTAQAVARAIRLDLIGSM